ncbi:MAG: hypothetical protein ACWGMZ_01545, partial [Thermoguttaceae bacterium]
QVSVGNTGQDTRIDAPHIQKAQTPEQVGPPSEDTVAQSSSSQENNRNLSENVSEERQIQRQGAQLAEHLRARQRDLDHRESQLNAAISMLESDVRAARVWLAEQEAEHQQRQHDLDNREDELTRRLERLAAAESALQRRSDTPAPTDASSPKQPAKKQAPGYDLDLQQRQRKLEIAEKRLEQSYAEAQKLHEQLTKQRALMHEELRLQRRQLVAQQRQALAELGKKRAVLELRSERLDQSREALIQLRDELRHTHRGTLEIRLAGEELWARLFGAAPPAALTQAVGQIRFELAKLHRLDDAELREQRKELEKVRDQLAKQYENLCRRKQQFEQWLALRQEESQKHCARIVAREKQLLKRQTRFDEQSQHWKLQRFKYEQEIGCLNLSLNPQTAEPAQA